VSFSLPRFLRRIAPKSLERYFAARQTALPGPPDWDAPHSDFLGALQQAIYALDEATHDRVIADLERANKLCDAVGQLALRSAVANNPALLRHLESEDSDESRALVVLLEDESAFDRALAISYGDHRRNGRSWSRYNVASNLIATNDPLGLQALRDDISRVLRDLNGSGRRLKIDYYVRQGRPTDGRIIGSTIHYLIYAEGLPESDLVFERGEPRRRTRRPAREAAIYYSSDQRVLEVVAEGGRLVRTTIAQAYARHILGLRDELRSIDVRPFALNRLKQPIEFPTDPGDGVKSVRITLLRLRNMVAGYGRATIEMDNSERTDIHAVSATWFGDFDPLQRPEWRVIMAKLTIVFFAEKPERRDKTVTVELRTPNGSNLREHIRHHQIVSEKYLARWGLLE
jgi:hypothetical protein